MPYFNNNEDIYRIFSREIIDKADQEINNLKSEVEEKKEKNLKRIKMELEASVNRGLDLDLNDLNRDFSSNLSKVKNEYTRVLIKKRHELLDSIVMEARSKCIDFVSSKEYKDFISNKLTGIVDKFEKKKVEFRVKKNDTVAIDVIKKEYNGKFEIQEVSDIEIGGFSVICFEIGVLIDETIDNKLKEKQQWFYEHSDLAAK
ncbi:MAG: hypothetical protein PHF05_01850 [Candidatus Izemoplasmatales bacterium]|nr:hypothetical protein [Candidatus Izemoplasmatales bacterium]